MPVEGDHVAIVGENRKMLVFPLVADPGNDARQGRAPAALQGWRRLDLKLLRHRRRADLAAIAPAAPSCAASDELVEWLGDRAAAGRMVPKGFPRSGKFGN